VADENSEQLDLLGDPWRPLKDQRGRKQHKWQAQLAEKVALLRASGLSHEEIADRVSLDPKTIRKYYSRELDNGPALAKAQIVEVIYAKAKEGNVSAARYIEDVFEKGRARRIATGQNKPVPKPVAPKLGKKEERLQAARRVGGLYATPAGPNKSQVQ